MRGDRPVFTPQAGMIPRSIEKIFEEAGHLRRQGWEFVLRATFLEVYNETIRDLIAKKGEGRGGGGVAR